jgi:hypothetical protein
MFYLRHFRPPHQHRHYRDISSKCRSQLDPHKVVGIVEAPVSPRILRIQPLLPDHREENAARRHALVDRFPEASSRLDRRHVHKYGLRTEAQSQIIQEAASFTLRVSPSIIDENGSQNSPPKGRKKFQRKENVNFGKFKIDLSPSKGAKLSVLLYFAAIQSEA